MRIEELVGQRVRARREELDMRQEEFGRRVGPLLGKSWSRSTVSVAEKGGRAWTAAELIAVAYVLETRPAHLLTPPIGVSEVELPGGATLAVSGMVDFSAAGSLLADVYEELRDLQQEITFGEDYSHQARLRVQMLADKLTTEVLAAGGGVSLPLAAPGADPSGLHSGYRGKRDGDT